MRGNERGSTISFIVVGVVLASLLVGGLYYVKNRTTPELATGDTSETVDTAATDTTGDDETTATPADESGSATTDTTDSNSDDTAASGDSASDTTAQSSDSATTDDDTTSTETAADATESEDVVLPATSTAEELPRTGASPSLGLIPLGILAAMVVAYRRSERAKA